jgi:hypothetical protein
VADTTPGRIVKNTGDGLLAEFASVVDAVRCAAEIQGEQSVKNIARPVRVYTLRTEGIADPPGSRVPVVARRRRSAVVAAISMVASVALVIGVVHPSTRRA